MEPKDEIPQEFIEVLGEFVEASTLGGEAFRFAGGEQLSLVGYRDKEKSPGAAWLKKTVGESWKERGFFQWRARSYANTLLNRKLNQEYYLKNREELCKKRRAKYAEKKKAKNASTKEGE